MPKAKSPRKGSLQFWPRKRAAKAIPSVNWEAIDSDKKIRGFLGYKAGMVSVAVKDNTPNSMTLGKVKIIPGTVIECPPMKIFSVRFYKDGQVSTEILAENLDKELKRKVKLPKAAKKIDSIKIEEYDDIRVIAYSVVKKTEVKKTPDLLELGLSGSKEDKLNFVKEKAGKEISITEVFSDGELLDVRGVTKGKGYSGPVKRFGITLKRAKSEKGRRRPGSLGPWHPARVIFRVPMAGQLGLFSRAHYNHKVLGIGAPTDEKLKNIKNYGNINTEYILVQGSVQGAAKKQIALTAPLRVSKKQAKKNYEVIELR